MGSLLQFNGQVREGKVGLEVYLTTPSDRYPDSAPLGKDAEPLPCSTCGRSHPRLYRVWRKPAGMFGCWVVFRILGQEMAPDLSHPLALFSLPRGAEPIPASEGEAIWHGPWAEQYSDEISWLASLPPSEPSG